MNKIAVICPYFGTAPSFFEATLLSMKNNEFIDWYLLTDITGYRDEPNVKFIPYSFDRLKKLIKSKIGTTIASPYKLCDYKPTFGDLFSSIFNGYDFWGYFDIDAIYGRLATYINDDLLSEYDKIYDLGHFSLYRNIPEVNMAYKGNRSMPIDFKKILNKKRIYVFDESYPKPHIEINQVLSDMGYRIYRARDYADLSILWKNFLPNDIQDSCHDYYFEYRNKSLYLKKLSDSTYIQEVAYAHFQQKKNIPLLTDQLNMFYILPKRITSDVSISDGFYDRDSQWLWYIRFRIKRKLSKLNPSDLLR